MKRSLHVLSFLIFSNSIWFFYCIILNFTFNTTLLGNNIWARTVLDPASSTWWEFWGGPRYEANGRSIGRLSKRVWQSHSLRLSTKIQVYRVVVVPSLLYGAETWVLYRKQIKLPEQFHWRCLRSILGIKWQDHVSNEEVLKRTSLPSIESTLLQVQLRLAGHVTRMEDVRMPKAVFFSGLREGKRDRGAPRKRYKDQPKRQLAQAGISRQSWQ